MDGGPAGCSHCAKCLFLIISNRKGRQAARGELAGAET